MTKQYLPLEQRIANETDFFHLLIDKIKFEIRVAAIAVVKSFDKEKQTISAQITTRERIFSQGNYDVKKIPIIEDIPVVMLRAGNFAITMPVTVGDECLLVFLDTCMDAWFQNGGEDNNQIFQRRHDISDCVAIVGIWNQQKVISDYAEDKIQIRSLNGETTIDVSDTNIEIKAPAQINIESSGTMEITSTGTMDIESSGIVSVKGTAVNINDGQALLSPAGIILESGLQGVARIGDSVDPTTHVIIGGSSKVFAG